MEMGPVYITMVMFIAYVFLLLFISLMKSVAAAAAAAILVLNFLLHHLTRFVEKKY